MNISVALIENLKANTSIVEVHSGTIPESAPIPAIAVFNVAFSNDRTLEGKKTKNVSNWRITVVDTVYNLQNTIDQILLLDNTSDDNFKVLFFELSLIEPKALDEPHQRAFIDVRAYPR